ncbi:hypothetical protein YERSI8AC_210101 [Enterobacterales bacterium 8AC]|nr:hypothetical protein YERSI8AC_210101 [Enterobacterales bacterium 8AC]
MAKLSHYYTRNEQLSRSDSSLVYYSSDTFRDSAVFVTSNKDLDKIYAIVNIFVSF